MVCFKVNSVLKDKMHGIEKFSVAAAEVLFMEVMGNKIEAKQGELDVKD